MKSNLLIAGGVALLGLSAAVTEAKKVSVEVVSWNVGSIGELDAKNYLRLFEGIVVKEDLQPDVFALALQETKIGHVARDVQAALKTFGGYKLCKKEFQGKGTSFGKGSTALYVFGKGNACTTLGTVSSTTVGNSAMGEAGNKGAAIVKFDDTSDEGLGKTCFVSTHQSMKGDGNQRLSSMANTISQLADCKNVFYAGDFNSRLYLDDFKYFSALVTNGPDCFPIQPQMDRHDELTAMLSSQTWSATCWNKFFDAEGTGPHATCPNNIILEVPMAKKLKFSRAKAAQVLNGFSEPKVQFKPTYKRVPSSKCDKLAGPKTPKSPGSRLLCRILSPKKDAEMAAAAAEELHVLKMQGKEDTKGCKAAGWYQYEKSNVKHNPAWTDRILLKTSIHIDVLAYSSINDMETDSDHAPVRLAATLTSDAQAAEEKKEAAEEKKEAAEGGVIGRQGGVTDVSHWVPYEMDVANHRYSSILNNLKRAESEADEEEDEPAGAEEKETKDGDNSSPVGDDDDDTADISDEDIAPFGLYPGEDANTVKWEDNPTRERRDAEYSRRARKSKSQLRRRHHGRHHGHRAH